MSFTRSTVPGDIKAEKLARCRLLRPGGMKYRAIPMTDDEIAIRRAYLRRTLSSYPRWENLSNEELNDIRLESTEGGYIAEDKNGYEFMLQSQQVMAKDAEFRRVRAMMPFEFMLLTGKDFDWRIYQTETEKAKGTVNDYIMHFEDFRKHGMGLYICSGTKGSGKTMLSCCLINEITKRYACSVKFVNVLELLEMTKKSYDGDTQEIDNIHNSGLLVVDDIGVQISKEWVDSVFYKLVNDRYVNKRPTIYTSNIAVKALKMDDRIVDRIESTTYNVLLPEESIRSKTRQQEKDKLMDEIKKSPTGRSNSL